MKTRVAKELTKDEIIAILREHLPELQRDYHVSYLGLFGSYVRGEQRKGYQWWTVRGDC